MQPSDDAPTPLSAAAPDVASPTSTKRADPHASKISTRAFALVRRAYRYTPAREGRLSIGALRAALLRTACCGVLLFAVLAPLQPLPHTDLYPGYVAADLANQGRWDHIYHRSVWLYNGADPLWDQRVGELTKGASAGTSFVYHPWYLQIMRPIVAHVSWPAFQQGWVVFSKGCVVAIGLGISLVFGFETLAGQALVTLAVGLSGTVVDGIELGQNVLPALVFGLAAVASWRSRTPLWVGGLFALLAWTCKPWCATLLLICFLLRGVRAGMITALALGALGGLLPTLVLPQQLMRDYREMTLAVTKISVYGYNNLSILSVFERLTFQDWSTHVFDWQPHEAALKLRLAALGSAGLVFIVGAILWWRRRPGDHYTVAAWFAFMLLPLGICWTHYFVFALPLALVCAFAEDSPVALRLLGVALLALLLGIPHVGVANPIYQSYLTQPVRYPWREAAPIVLVGCALLAALALAPSARPNGAAAA
jgi:hypothetical protein